MEHAADVLLACACAAGDPQAIQRVESQILSQMDVYLARFTRDPQVVDEIRQQVRVKLFVGDPPGIALYRGHGPLGAWIRVTAVRMAIDLFRSEAAATAWSESGLFDLAIAVDDGPERAAARQLYRERFRAALEQAIATLEARDRTLLRLFVVDGLNIEAIGAIYGVHRATVARWFVAIRGRVVPQVRENLGLPKPPSISELRSLVELLRDEIVSSASGILAVQPVAVRRAPAT